MPAECLDWSQSRMVPTGPYRRRRVCRVSVSPTTVVAFVEFKAIFETGADEDDLDLAMKLVALKHRDKKYPLVAWCELFRAIQGLITQGYK